MTGSSRPSEDRIRVLPHAVLVLDGATNLGASIRSGGWYADLLADEIAEMLQARPTADLSDTLANGIRAVTAAHGLVPGDSPSSTVAIARWDSTRVDALVLADSPIVAFGSHGWHVLSDDQLRQLPPSRHHYPTLLRQGYGYGKEHLEALRAGMATTSGYRNTKGGFWVAEADPAAARHAARGSWDRATTDAVLLATDGVSCSIDDYELFNWPELLDLARTRGPHAVLTNIDRAESNDPHGQRWPRPKRHDDKALVLIDYLNAE